MLNQYNFQSVLKTIFTGIVDIIKMEAWDYENETKDGPTLIPVPQDLVENAQF